jgi:tetratricopeptide (TPR) repeat protein
VDAGALEFGPDLQASFFEEVSRAWRHQARYADAFDLARRAVELREKHWGERHPLTLRAKKRLADVHYKQRDFRSAESLGIAVLADLVTYVGPHHPDAAGIDTLLGNIAWRRGSYDVANAHFENAQRVWTQLFGAEDPRAVRMVEARAAVHVSAGQFADAWEMLEPLLARTSSPREPPGGRAKLASGASEALIGMGRYEEAAELLRMALTTLVREKGESHAELGYALLGMGGLELARGNAARAEEHCQRAVALWKEQLGERHPKLSWAYACLGRAELERAGKGCGRDAESRAVAL